MQISLSIIVPTYQGERTLKQCLQAISESMPSGCELLVSDDGSDDRSCEIAELFASRVIRSEANRGVATARNAGATIASGDLICFVDQDVVITRNSLSLIVETFESRPDVAALTGMLTKDTPFRNFSSDYKNLYMFYTFDRLPEEITFLYGSIYAIRRSHFDNHNEQSLLPDTDLGQSLFLAGKKIILLKSAQGVHLKSYTFYSLIKNDFDIPFLWSLIFMKNRSWRNIGEKKTGFAHASCSQLASLIIVYLIVLIVLGTLVAGTRALGPLIFLGIAWFLLNFQFFRLLFNERGIAFTLKASCFTFIDQFVMGLGVLCGIVHALIGLNSLLPKRLLLPKNH